jgi:hypothetical protein
MSQMLHVLQALVMLVGIIEIVVIKGETGEFVFS